MMRADRRYYGQPTGMAIPLLTFLPIDPAFPGAYITRSQACFKPGHPTLKFTGLVQSNIAWFQQETATLPIYFPERGFSNPETSANFSDAPAKY